MTEKHFYKEIADKLDEMIMCNNIAEKDETIQENIKYGEFWEEKIEEEGEDYYPEIYQYFLLDCNEYHLENLQEHYPELIYSYSNLLDLFVLCVPHCGTGWDLVETAYED